MKRIWKHLTFANVVACLALFVALGGVSYAAFRLPKNSVGAKQLKKGAVTPTKLSRGSRATLTGPRGPTGPAGVQGPQGSKGDTGPAGSSLAYARIDELGKIDLGRSKGIGGMKVDSPETGLYCISNLPFELKSAIATTQGGQTSLNDIIGSYAPCPEPQTQVSVSIWSTSASTKVGVPFMILFN